jgi:hypothetical protein
MPRRCGAAIAARIGASLLDLGCRRGDGQLISAPFLKGAIMDIRISEEVYQQLEQVKEWMESKIGREVTWDDVLVEILKNFQMVLHPEDLGSA